MKKVAEVHFTVTSATFLYCGLQSELVNLHVLHLSLATLGDIFFLHKLCMTMKKTKIMQH